MKRPNSQKGSGTRRMADPAIRTEIRRNAVKRSIVYTAIGLSVLLPGLPKRALAQLAPQIQNAETVAAPAAISINGIDYVAWIGKNISDPKGVKIWYATSTDNGATWAPQTNFSTSIYTKLAPALAAVGSTVYLAWQDATDEVIQFTTCSTSSPCTATPFTWGPVGPAYCPKCATLPLTTAAPALARLSKI
jgi:hypothetical protein